MCGEELPLHFTVSPKNCSTLSVVGLLSCHQKKKKKILENKRNVGGRSREDELSVTVLMI